MKNINKYFVVIFLIVVGIAFSCENYLDIPQQGVQSIDDFYQTDSHAMSALGDIYTEWRSNMVGTHVFGTYLEYMSGDTYPGWANMGDNSGMAHSMYTFTFDGEMRSTCFYTGPAGMIRRTNTILARVEPDTPAKRRVLAECRVIRAWAYSYLAFFYGDVPLFEEEITATNAARPSSPVAEVWAFVNKDFETAINSGDLPSKSSVNDRENVLRTTKEAAQALYGKMLLWQERWGESAAQLKAVINSDKYQLLGDDQLLNHNGEPDFGYVVRAATSLGPESLLELNSKADQNGNSGTFAYGGGSFAWRTDQLTYNGGVFSYLPEYDIVGMGNGGAGTSKKSLYDAFLEIEGPNGFRLKGSILTWEEMQTLGFGINGIYYCTEGYWDIKWRRTRSESGNWTWGTGTESPFNNVRILRYAEVLLSAAEACIRSNDAASALIYTNMVRERAHLPPLASVTLTDIKKEKRLELYKEAVRYIDLVRWEKLQDPDGITASNVLGEQGHYIPNFNGVTVNDQALIMTQYGWKKGKHELMPIPVAELNANPYLTQNSGW